MCADVQRSVPRTREGRGAGARLAGVLLACASLTASNGQTTPRSGRLELVSIGPDRGSADRDSFHPSISADGRIVAFASLATDLVADDANNSDDVFVFDRLTGQTTRVSLAAGGQQADDDSHSPAVSPDGGFVVFASDATNLVPGDANGVTDIFVVELRDGRVTRVSVSSVGGEANGPSFAPSVSTDGRWIAFHSVADNLAPADDNRDRDVFLHDRLSGQTVRVSGPESGGAGWDAQVSPDGRFVAFSGPGSGAAGAPDAVYLHDRLRRETVVVSVASDGRPADHDSFDPSVSSGGRRVAFASCASNLSPGDTNGAADVFVRDCAERRTLRVSVGAGGAEADGGSFAPALSADGRWVAFWSRAENLVEDDRNGRGDVFLHDLQTGRTQRVSAPPSGAAADGHSAAPAVSNDGRFVAFQSGASNLVACDQNRRDDVFVAGTCEGFVPGDSNGDGVVDERDIDAFVMAVTDPCRYQRVYPRCDLICVNDLNGDGEVDFFDTDGFVDEVYGR